MSFKTIQVAGSVKGGELVYSFTPPINLSENCEIALKSYEFEKTWLNIDRATEIKVWKYDLATIANLPTSTKLPSVILDSYATIHSSDPKIPSQLIDDINAALLKIKVLKSGSQTPESLSIPPTLGFEEVALSDNRYRYNLSIAFGFEDGQLYIPVFDQKIFRMFSFSFETYIDLIEARIRKSAKQLPKGFDPLDPTLEFSDFGIKIPNVLIDVRSGFRIISLTSNIVENKLIDFIPTFSHEKVFKENKGLLCFRKLTTNVLDTIKIQFKSAYDWHKSDNKHKINFKVGDAFLTFLIKESKVETPPTPTNTENNAETSTPQETATSQSNIKEISYEEIYSDLAKKKKRKK